MEKLVRIVIKKEFVELLGDFKLAVILNQFLYWLPRMKDFDKFISEERRRSQNEGIDFTAKESNGWIYKTAKELSEEIMVCNEKVTRRGLQTLVELGYLFSRTNPQYKWDRTLQYKVNLSKLSEDLYKLGYPLEGFNLAFSSISSNENIETVKMTESKSQNDRFKKSNCPFQKVKLSEAIPEITTEITTEIKKEKRVKESEGKERVQKPKATSTKTTSRFVPPSLEEIELYLLEKNIKTVSSSKFKSYYDSVGWKRGNTPIKNWKACITAWRMNENTHLKANKNIPSNRHNGDMTSFTEENIYDF